MQEWNFAKIEKLEEAARAKIFGLQGTFYLRKGGLHWEEREVRRKVFNCKNFPYFSDYLAELLTRRVELKKAIAKTQIFAITKGKNKAANAGHYPRAAGHFGQRLNNNKVICRLRGRRPHQKANKDITLSTSA